MIFDKLQNFEKYNSISSCVLEVAKWVANNQFNDRPGKQEVQGNDWFYINLNYVTKQSFEDLVFEAHRKYLDIHIVIEGQENVKVLDIGLSNQLNEYQVEGDYQLFKSNEQDCSTIILGKGDFLVLEPNEVHATGYLDAIVQVQKRVIKIPLKDE